MFCTEVHTFLSHLIILKETLWASNYVQDSSFDICWSNKPKNPKVCHMAGTFFPVSKYPLLFHRVYDVYFEETVILWLHWSCSDSTWSPTFISPAIFSFHNEVWIFTPFKISEVIIEENLECQIMSKLIILEMR